MPHRHTEKYQPTSYSTASAAERNVRFMKSAGNLTLLAAIDKLIPAEKFAQFLVGPKGELQELAFEMNQAPFRPAEFVGELNDVMVFVFSWYIAHGIRLDLSEVPYRRNSRGNHSDVIEVLERLSWEFLSDPRAGVEIAQVTSSMMYYADLPGPKYRLYQNFENTIEKVLSNRPPEFYGDKDYFTGKPLTEDQVQAKYQFNEKVFRTLRANRLSPEKPLSAADILPWKEYLYGWNVAGMMNKFQQDFAAHKAAQNVISPNVLVWSRNQRKQKVS